MDESVKLLRVTTRLWGVDEKTLGEGENGELKGFSIIVLTFL
jgi:hypothetical protein